MREVAVVSFAQSATDQDVRNEVEIVMPVAAEAIEAAGLTGARVARTGHPPWTPKAALRARPSLAFSHSAGRFAAPSPPTTPS